MLKDFQRLCILKGIYPQQLHGRVPGNTKVQSFYHIKDIRARTMAIMTERARALREMGAILEKESQQILLTELHDAEHLLGSESKGFLYELIKGGLDKVRSFVEAENPEVPKIDDEENQDDAGAVSTTNNKDTKLLNAKEFLEYVIGKADKLSKDEQWSDSFTLALFGKSSRSTSCQHYLSGLDHDKDGMIKAAWEALREVGELDDVRVTWGESLRDSNQSLILTASMCGLRM